MGNIYCKRKQMNIGKDKNILFFDCGDYTIRTFSKIYQMTLNMTHVVCKLYRSKVEFF